MNKETRPHPDHEQLLLYCDGEIGPAGREVTQKHLEACWECRHELQQLEEAIGDAVQYRREVLARHLPPPPLPWRDLSAGFAEADRELTPPGFIDRLAAALRMPRVALPLAAAVLGATVFIARTRVQLATPLPEVAANEERPAATAIAPPRESTPPAVSPPVPAPATAPAGTEMELGHSAVEVFAALHAMGADLGDPVEVSRRDGRVLVRGYGLDRSRIDELAARLAAIPFVELRLRDTGAPTGATAPVRLAIAAAGPSPLQGELERELGGGAAVEAFASENLDSAEAVILRAHALHRLSEQFSTGGLSAADQQVLRALRRDHARGAVNEVERLRRNLAPMLRVWNVPVTAVAPGNPSESALLAAARKLETSIAELSGAVPPAAGAGPLPNRLAADLALTAALVEALAVRD